MEPRAWVLMEPRLWVRSWVSRTNPGVLGSFETQAAWVRSNPGRLGNPGSGFLERTQAVSQASWVSQAPRRPGFPRLWVRSKPRQPGFV
ncbi:hypothetical protein SLEP1_g18310 [Rubroshorea leprosula]|uniref:Uncharacterized protein n=1 Tax=Rubroshorea leprosula TaxID=152421 RepID=A0AAV5IX11_9ROSI|nr:hypothetical protein SLEP1_g18310 [Rubroshorea leprosula]